jgi:outer membrane receptor for ferric coprogen and ferric-rhodotorulic acid
MVANYTPKNLFRGTLSYQFSQLPELKVGINLLWQDRISRFQGVVGSPYSNAGEAIISQQGGYSRVNVMASYQLNQQLSISLNANNLFDTTYLNSLLWSQAYYGAPRNLSASLRLQF